MPFFKPKRAPEPDPPFFAWLEGEHGTGIPTFDKEHQKIFMIISRIHARAHEERVRTPPLDLLDQLRLELTAHFSHEEQVMEEAGFPDRAGHAAEHAALVRELQDLLKRFHSGGISVLALPAFLKKWFVTHISDSDRKYAAHLRRNGFR